MMGQKAIREGLVAKAKTLLEGHAYAPAKEAAQKWLDTLEDAQANAEATKAYVAALEEAVMSVDELIDFAGSDAGKQVFGDKQAEVLAHAKELKAQGRGPL